jgi:hypothetical protein
MIQWNKDTLGQTNYLMDHFFFMDKKDKKLCMCIDYNALNKITIKNNYPLHQIDDLFNCRKGVSYFNQIDLKSSYYQIHVEKENVKKMAMMVRYNFYEFLVMLLRLCNAPSTFTTLMKSIFHEKLDEFVIIYICMTSWCIPSL